MRVKFRYLAATSSKYRKKAHESIAFVSLFLLSVLFRRAGAFDDRAHRAVDVDGLGEVGVHARGEAFLNVLMVGVGCEGDDGDVLRLRHARDGLAVEVKQLRQLHRLRDDLEFPALDARDIQHIVDELLQIAAADLDLFQALFHLARVVRML